MIWNRHHLLHTIRSFLPGGKIQSVDTSASSVANETIETSPVSWESNTKTVSPPESEIIPVIVSTSVQNKVESIIEADDTRKLRYFLMELIRKNTGISTPSVEISEYKSTKISTKIPGKFKNESSILRILIQESTKWKWILIDDKSIRIWNFLIELESGYSSWGGFSVDMSGKIESSDMECLRDFFERIFLSEYQVNEQRTMNSTQIRELLELTEKDFVLLDDKFLEISIPLENEIMINDSILESIATVLNNDSHDFSVKQKKYGNSKIEERSFTIYDIKKQFGYDVLWGFFDGKLTIRIGSTYSSLQIDRNFIEVILKKIIYLLSNSTLSKKSSLQALRDMGVLVFEKNPDESKKTLGELYEEHGFVWYEDIKELLTANIIHPWEQRDEYLRISKEKFPHMNNIIPNTALFEWPPWTGKTTQAKIIGRYLGYPFIYIPIGKLMSKWYGESEGRLDKIFELARKAAEENGGIIAMIDEIDEIGKNRENSHEATGRMTGVLLKKLDGIEQVANILLIGSTNRKDSMDEALLSRFSRQVYFRLPNTPEIRHILTFYIPEARELSDKSIQKIEGKSGRDIKNIAEDIARKYMEAEVINKAPKDINIILQEYLQEK